MRPIKHDAIQNDQRLMEMALYEVTKGQTQHASYEKLVKKIAEYKGIIKRGTFSLDELEDKIFSRFGVIDERSKTDTAIYDASQEMGLGMGTDPIASLFGGLFRKSQGLPSGYPPPVGIDDPEAPNESKQINLPDDVDDELKELNDRLEKDQLDEDFPIDPKGSKEDPDDDLPF